MKQSKCQPGMPVTFKGVVDSVCPDGWIKVRVVKPGGGKFMYHDFPAFMLQSAGRSGENELLDRYTMMMADSSENSEESAPLSAAFGTDRESHFRLLSAARVRAFWARAYMAHYRIRARLGRPERRRVRRILSLLRRAQKLIEQEGNISFADFIAKQEAGKEGEA